MIPILFEGTETEFTTNGLGRLSDAISCKVVEEKNATYELSMEYPVNGLHFSDIAEGKIILAQPFDGGLTQPFTIYQITKPLNQVVTIKAQHISYMLSGIVVMPFTVQSCAAAMVALPIKASTTCPFNFTTDKTATGPFIISEPRTIRNALCGQSGSLLDVYGKGEYEFNRFDVILHTNRGSDNGVTLRYGKNITDLKDVVDMSNVYTGIVPYWTSTDGVTMTLTEKVVMSGHESEFPYKIIKPVDFSSKFDSQPTQAQLRAAAESYLESNAGWNLKNNVTVSFVALWNTEEYKDIAPLERVKMGDTVHIEVPKMGVSVSTKVIKTDFNVLLERYNSITLGDTYYTITSIINEELADIEETQSSHMDQAIAHATKLIQGGLGGHVVFNTDADGKPQEILIMDTDSTSTAVNVIRMNRNGIGFSTTGYNGPFTSAWTIDGHFVADFIDTGTLNADIIKAGVISDEANKNYWDMRTGEFRLAATATIGGKTADTIASDTLNTWVTNTYSPDKTNLQNQIDGKAETWYQSADPSTAWTTAELKAQHEGDLWYNTTNGTTWYYKYDSGTQTYSWDQQNIPTAVFDEIDGKAQIFTSTTNPTPPYDVGDLWFQGTTSGIMTCIVAKAEGQSYAASDWQERNKYVDSDDINSAMEHLNEILDQEEIFDRLTDNGTVQGIFMDQGQLYINATYISTGIIEDAAHKFRIDMDTGSISMADATFSGSISGSSITGSTITGSTIQTSATGARMLMDTTATLYGSSGTIDQQTEALLRENILNMAQTVSGQSGTETQMTIDAQTQLNIRVPKLCVENASHGTDPSTVYDTVTSSSFGFVSGISKVQYPGEPGHECWETYVEEGTSGIYCTLPVFLNVSTYGFNVMHGMLLSGGQSTSVII